jgi:hypothetical protein
MAATSCEANIGKDNVNGWPFDLYVLPRAPAPISAAWRLRAYYADGPWSGLGYSYAGWSDYAARNGILCTPGTVIKGGNGILYLCQ